MSWISKAALAELQGYVDVYGKALEEHHGSRDSCKSTLLRISGAAAAERRRAASELQQVTERVTELERQLVLRAEDIRALTEERDTATKTIEARAIGDLEAGFAS